MEKIINKTVLTVALVLGVAAQVSAHLVTPEGNLVVGYNDTQQSMDALVGMDVDELWKWDKDAGGALSGGGFNINFSADMLTATLSWDLTGTGTQLYAVAWKDGTLIEAYNPENLGFYWSAVTESQRVQSDGDVLKLTVDLSPDFKNPDAWSHIAFYGKSGSTSVPDGGATLALIGIAMTGLGLLRRKMK